MKAAIIITMLLLSSACWAEQSNVVPFVGALATIVGTHELSHYVAAETTGEDIHFDTNGNWTVRSAKRDNAAIIGGAGFVGTMALSEAVLRVKPEKPYLRSIVYAQMAYSLAYIAWDARANRDNSDFDAIKDNSGLGREITYPLALIIPAWQCWRMWRQGEENSNKAIFIDMSKGTICLNLTYEF